MTKKLFTSIFWVSGALAVTYLACAFVVLDMDFRNWGPVLRFFFALVGAISCIAAAIVSAEY